MGAGHHLDPLGQIRVPGHTPMKVPDGADQVRLHLGVTRVGLGARDPDPIAIARHRERVDRIDLIARSH
jgi:hypothetical protein